MTELERVEVTGETKRKFREPLMDSADSARVSDAVVEPTIAEQLEAERLEKAMRGEEHIDGLEEEREEWPIGTNTKIKYSHSRLQSWLPTTPSEQQSEEHQESSTLPDSSQPVPGQTIQS